MEEKDGHIASEMGKRRRALILDWEITAPDNASARKSATPSNWASWCSPSPILKT
jgi:phage gp29-like protein